MEGDYKMFKIQEDKKAIGIYLSELIDRKYCSKRQFCKAYIEASGTEASNEEIQRMANRISQIIKGTKSIQTYDLPIFTELLGVSCEELLSAGKNFVPIKSRLTNYSVAFVKDEAVWEQYVNREDKLILNTDEYGKTVIDYALEFKNFEFVKYLLENKYIWFVKENFKEHFMEYEKTFGAGTSIERRMPQERDRILWYVSSSKNGTEQRLPQERDVLQYMLAGNDDLRMKMVSLAIEHDEIELLYQLRAREIPSLYWACHSPWTAESDSYYNDDMILHISRASERVMDYFSEEFEIENVWGRIHKFLFPFMGDLLDLLVKNSSKYAVKMLGCSIAHNQDIYDKLKRSLHNAINCQVESMMNAIHCIDEDYKKIYRDEVTEKIVRDVDFHDNDNMVSFIDRVAKEEVISNIIYVDEVSNDDRINNLIQELNDSYSKIYNIGEAFNK